MKLLCNRYWKYLILCKNSKISWKKNHHSAKNDHFTKLGWQSLHSYDMKLLSDGIWLLLIQNKWCFFCACSIFINSWKFAWKFVSNQQICLLLFGMTKKTKEDNPITISINLCYVIPIFTFCFALGLKLIFLRYQVH